MEYTFDECVNLIQQLVRVILYKVKQISTLKPVQIYLLLDTWHMWYELTN